MSAWHLLKGRMQQTAFDMARISHKNLDEIIFMRLNDRFRSRLKLVSLRSPVVRVGMKMAAQYAFEEHYEYDSETLLLKDIEAVNQRRKQLVFGVEQKSGKTPIQKRIARQKMLDNESMEDRKKRIEWEKRERMRKFLFSKPGKRVKITYHTKELK